MAALVVLSFEFRMLLVSSSATPQVLQKRARSEVREHGTPVPVGRMPMSEQQILICGIYFYLLLLLYFSFLERPPF